LSAIRSGLNLARIGVFLVFEIPFRPRWAYYRARGYAYHYLLNRLHQKRTNEYERRKKTLQAAVAYVLDRRADDVRAVDDSDLIKSMIVQGNWVAGLGSYAGEKGVSESDGPIEVQYGPSPELVRLINIVCRLLRPDYVVETGVARGFTTASTLEALDRNGGGQMYSVELPSLYIGYAGQVGELIPDRLRERWVLEFGPSAIVMPRIARKIGKIDLFVHDSAANYDNQMTEFRIALANMPAGGVIVSDMLNSDAFLETAEAIQCRWAVVEQSKPFPLGLLCKLPNGPDS
jgi:predicted O-methyltransferase YrrM